MKEYLGFTQGMMMGMGMDHGKAENHKVFDWIKAAKLIREHCMVGELFNAKIEVSAGLAEDWGCTSGPIFSEGSIVNEDDTYAYLSSSWATPIIDIGGEEHECWSYRKDVKSEDYWHAAAVNILNSKPTERVKKLTQ